MDTSERNTQIDYQRSRGQHEGVYEMTTSYSVDIADTFGRDWFEALQDESFAVTLRDEWSDKNSGWRLVQDDIEDVFVQRDRDFGVRVEIEFYLTDGIQRTFFETWMSHRESDERSEPELILHGSEKRWLCSQMFDRVMEVESTIEETPWVHLGGTYLDVTELGGDS